MLAEASHLILQLDHRQWFSEYSKLTKRIKEKGVKGPKLTVLKHLMSRADQIPINKQARKYMELKKTIEDAESCIKDATAAFAPKAVRLPACQPLT